MENRVTQWLLVLVLCFSVAVGVMGQGGQTGKPEEKEGLFLLQDSKSVVKTDAGEMKVVRGLGGGVFGRPMHIGLITMEPKTLFIPQYLDSNLILFIRTGEVKIGFIYKDEGVEKNLTSGDVYRIPAGSTFYLVNTGSGQRLHIICSIDTSESLGIDAFQSFFIGGGTYPTSVLAGFSPETLTTAFNVSIGELREFLTKQRQGPIMYINDSKRPGIWEKFLQLKEQDRIQHLKKMVGFQDQEEEHSTSWSWRKLLISVFGNENKKKSESESEAPESYNLYDRSPDFKNKYGWSLALDEDDYSELRRSGIGLYLVNLTAGSMMAPHVNPTATEYGIVLRGFGSIEVVFPNGTSAMKTQVKEGDVFWVPRYFPFCQIASRNGPFEFFGFTTSSRKNRPQFLAGSNSVLQTLRGSEMAAAFGVTQEVFDLIVGAQNESVIIPTPSAAPPDQMLEPENEEMMLQIERVPKLSRF